MSIRFKGYKISGSGAVLALFCFFMPWVQASCYGMDLGSYSGWQLAVGPLVDTGFGMEKLDGTPILFLALIVSLVVIGLAYKAAQRDSLRVWDRWGLVVLGALPLLMFMFLSGIRSELAADGFFLALRTGFWGVVFGNLAIVAGGIVNHLDSGLEVEAEPVPEFAGQAD